MISMYKIKGSRIVCIFPDAADDSDYPPRKLAYVSVNDREVCEHLESSGNLEWTDKSRRRAYVFWKSPAQFGTEIYR